MLLDAKADAAAKDSMGTCALLEACQHGHDAIIDLLLKDHSLYAPLVQLQACLVANNDPPQPCHLALDC